MQLPDRQDCGVRPPQTHHLGKSVSDTAIDGASGRSSLAVTFFPMISSRRKANGKPRRRRPPVAGSFVLPASRNETAAAKAREPKRPGRSLSGLGGLRGTTFVDPADPGAGFHDDG